MRLKLYPLLASLALFSATSALAQISDTDARLHAISPLTVLVGDELTVTASITNGSGALINGLDVPFRIFKNADPSTIREQIGTSGGLKIDAGESDKFTTAMTIPANATLGLNTLGYQLIAPHGDGSWVFFDTPITILARDDVDLKQRSAADQQITPNLDSYAPGASIVASTVINNGGGSKSGPFSVQWRLSIDTVLGNGDDTVIGERAYPDGIGANGSEFVTVEAPLTLPVTLDDDEYVLGCVINTGIDAIPANNKIVFTQRLEVIEPSPTGVDLTFATPQFHDFAPAVISAGQPLAVQFRAANIGTLRSGSFTLKINASRLGFLDSGIELGTIDYHSGAQPGVDPATRPGLFDMSVAISNTTGLTAGESYYLRVELISAEDTDNSNNLYVHPTPFRVSDLLPDLEPLDDWEIVQPPGGLLRDMNNCLHIRGTVRNNGPGSSAATRFRVNCRRFGNLNNVIRNYEFSIPDYYWRSPPEPINPYYLLNDLPPLAPGESVYIDRMIPLKLLRTIVLDNMYSVWPINDGLFTVRIEVDSTGTSRALGFQRNEFGNNIQEIDETNNEIRLPGHLNIINSEGFPNLFGSFATDRTAYQPGQTMKIDGTLVNDRRPGSGQTAINGFAGISFVDFFLGDTKVGTLGFPPLLQGESSEFSDYELEIPIGLPWGTHEFNWKVDARDDIEESSECDNGNNSGAILITIGPLPDLLPASTPPVEFSTQSALQGSPFTVSGEVQNFGLSIALPSTARVYLSSDGTISPDDRELNSARIPQLSSFAKVPFSITGRPGNFMPDGRYYVLLRLDSDDEVEEVNEGNNDFNLGAVRIGGSANLGSGNRLPEIQVVENEVDGEFSFSFTTFNSGNISSTGHRVLFYAQDGAEVENEFDVEIAAKSVLLGEYLQAEAIAPGTSITKEINFKLRRPLEVGDYRVVVLYDADDQVAESNENDNTAISRNLVTIDTPVGDFKSRVFSYSHDSSTSTARLYSTCRTGVTYQLQISNDLRAGSWSNYGNPKQGEASGLLEWDANSDAIAPRKYFRIVPVP